MKFRYDDLARKGWLLAPDEQGGGAAGAPEGGEGGGVQTSAEGAAGAAAAGAAASQGGIHMTQEEFDAALGRASSRALADAKAEQETARRQTEAREAEARRRQAATSVANPQMDALEAIDIRSDMLEEALTLHPDMPLAARQQLKEDLRSFRSIDQVRAAKDAGLHIKLADAAAGNAIRQGTYTPKSTQTVTREPAHSEVVKSAIPDSYRKEMEAEYASMGMKVTEKDIAEAYELDRYRQ